MFGYDAINGFLGKTSDYNIGLCNKIHIFMSDC